MIMGTRPFSKAKEMRVQQDDNGIPQTYHPGRKTINGSS
jgi:hypothetical protein